MAAAAAAGQEGMPKPKPKAKRSTSSSSPRKAGGAGGKKKSAAKGEEGAAAAAGGDGSELLGDEARLPAGGDGGEEAEEVEYKYDEESLPAEMQELLRRPSMGLSELLAEAGIEFGDPSLMEDLEGEAPEGFRAGGEKTCRNTTYLDITDDISNPMPPCQAS